MRNSYNAVLMLMLFLVVAGSAFAQNMPEQGNAKPAEPVLPSPENDNGARILMQYAANNDAFDRLVTETAKTLYRRQVNECPTIEQAVRQLPTPYGALTFPATTYIVKFPPPLHGLWVEHIKIRGCGKLYQINILGIGRQSGQDPVILGLLPGETMSDPGQQGNVVRMASQTIRKANASCSDDPQPYYTRLIGYKQADGTIAKTESRLGWFEEWTFRFCQKTLPVQIAFLPDGRGGYDIKTRIPDAAPASPEKPTAEMQQSLIP